MWKWCRLLVLAVVLSACQQTEQNAPRQAAPEERAGDARLSDAGLANGERIFRNGRSRSSVPIRSTGALGQDSLPTLCCSDCHGANGRGGLVVLADRRVVAPDITFDALTRGRLAAGAAPYTDVTFGLTLRTGVTPDGRKLDTLMPRWRIGAADMGDLIHYLKSIVPVKDTADTAVAP